MNEEKKMEEMVMAPTAWVDDGSAPLSDLGVAVTETPVITDGYVDARTDEERANEPESVMTTSSDTLTQESVQVDLTSRIVPPHNKVSRDVTQEDLKRVLVDAYVLRDLCFSHNGLFAAAYAMAHPQIDATDPLNFFVLSDGRVIINPKIINHTRHSVDSQEACMTYPNLDQRVVQRYNKVEVEFQSIEGSEEEPTLTEKLKVSLSGRQAKIFQHEMEHLLGKYIFGDDLEKPDLGYRIRNNGGGIIINKKEEVSKK